MKKSLTVSVVSGVLGVLLIGGILTNQTEPVSFGAKLPNLSIVELPDEITIPIRFDIPKELAVSRFTEYDRNNIRFYLQEVENGNMTEASLNDLYEKYGTKVDEIKEEMQREYKEQEIENNKPAKSTLLQTGGIISYSCNKKLESVLQSYIDKVPKNILDAIQGIGYTIELVKDPGKEYGYRNICGLTCTDEKRILIKASKSKFRRAVVHEIGHAYDDYLGWVSGSEEFKKIYKAEKNKFKVHDYISTHYLDNEREYFAEAFQEYIYYPKKLKVNTPETYKFMTELIEF